MDYLILRIINPIKEIASSFYHFNYVDYQVSESFDNLENKSIPYMYATVTHTVKQEVILHFFESPDVGAFDVSV